MNSDPDKRAGWRRVTSAMWAEVAGLRPRLHLLAAVAGALPRRGGGAQRASLMRIAGFSVGRGCRVEGMPQITGGAGLFERLSIGNDCTIEPDCVLDLEERITLEDDVTVGPGVMILTSTHELASAVHRAGPVTKAPVVVGKGAWLRARAIVLPGVTVGAGAIVEAGAVVNKDVAPHTRVGGLPAVQLEVLGEGDG